MNEWVIRAAIAAVIGLCGIGAGKIYADESNEGARRKQNEENERVRQMLKSVLATFAGENKKMEEVIADLVKNPPADMKELETRLRTRCLSDDQVGRIISRARGAGLYKAA